MILVVERRQVRQVALLIGLLVVVGCLWWVARTEAPQRLVYTPPITQETMEMEEQIVPALAVNVGNSDEFYSEYRLQRDRVRASQEELLRAAAQNKDLSDQRRAQLSSELMTLLKKGEQEMQAESLLQARGFSEAAVVMGYKDVTVVVPEVLTSSDAAVVGELIARICGVGAENITIMDGAGKS